MIKFISGVWNLSVKPSGVFSGGRSCFVHSTPTGEGEGNHFTSRGVNLACSSPSIHSDFCCFSQRARHGTYSPCSYKCVVQVRWAYTMPMCVLFVLIFVQWAGFEPRTSWSTGQFFSTILLPLPIGWHYAFLSSSVCECPAVFLISGITIVKRMQRWGSFSDIQLF